MYGGKKYSGLEKSCWRQVATLIRVVTVGLTEQVTCDHKEKQVRSPGCGIIFGMFKNNQQDQCGWSGVSYGEQ